MTSRASPLRVLTYLFSSILISVKIEVEQNDQRDITHYACLLTFFLPFSPVSRTNSSRMTSGKLKALCTVYVYLFSSIFIRFKIKLERNDQRDIEGLVADFPAVLLLVNLSHFQLQVELNARLPMHLEMVEITKGVR